MGADAGTVILLLARERYHLVLWVVLFLALTWVSTLFFGRTVFADGAAPGLLHEVTSYVTRALYQETLFFLLPFYATSTVIDVAQRTFCGPPGRVGPLSCIDLLFDRWLRTRPVFALTFFASLRSRLSTSYSRPDRGLRPRLAAPLRPCSPSARRRLWLCARHPRPGGGPDTAPGGRGGDAGRGGGSAAVDPSGSRSDCNARPSRRESNPIRWRAGRYLPRMRSFGRVSGALAVLAESLRAVGSRPRTSNSSGGATGNSCACPVRSASSPTPRASGSGMDGTPRSGSVPPGRYRVVLRTSGRRVFGVAKLTVGG